jgi:hypothetical protein
MGFIYDLCLLTFVFSTAYSNIKPANTKDWLIEFHHHTEPDVAKSIAKRYAMVSRGPVDLFINYKYRIKTFPF